MVPVTLVMEVPKSPMTAVVWEKGGKSLQTPQNGLYKREAQLSFPTHKNEEDALHQEVYWFVNIQVGKLCPAARALSF